MKRINVLCQSGRYDIVIGRNLLASIGRLLKPLKLGSKILIVSNKRVALLFLEKVRRSLVSSGFDVTTHFLPRGDERDKSKDALFTLWEAMAQKSLERSSAVLALGGGVVGDVAGFAGSTYMRGISLIQVPTTLLAQVDSAIGGKTAIDLPMAKNMVGTFYPPCVVVSDVETLRTLPSYDFANQFAEVIKYGIISDTPLFELLERKLGWFLSSVDSKKFGASALSFLEEVVWRSAKVKARVVREDEYETKGTRMILNYGHTFAHAFEASSRFHLPHGEAVAIGMIAAARLAARLKIFSTAAEERQFGMIQQLGLRTSLAGLNLKTAVILSAMLRDKKVKAGKLRFVLPVQIGKVVIKDNVSLALVRRVLQEVEAK